MTEKSKALGFKEFEFDLPEALLSQLVRELDNLQPVELSQENLTTIPEVQGVYQLFLGGELVYIGKTDAKSGLKRRLVRHASKVLHRKGLDPTMLTFRAIRIFVFTAIDLERQLIEHYGSQGRRPKWDGSGFGANDPGKERDSGKPGKFDNEFPIDIDRPIEWTLEGRHTVARSLDALRRVLPYTFRFQSPHADLIDASFEVRGGFTTAREVVQSAVNVLPPGWQGTALAKTLTLYKQHRDDLPGAEIVARS